ncbi:monosaccharide ABC transporter substrate-binding protein (CUT2 family) [Thermasporomyces composti]|jgi:ribose transport system substrate-binding protein|uniref:Monosaccharide ABC transporter substrate-binding protein (CUT2 family) n=1 Tax=Thermasporomyces composti TaxID=696763 RepID=A0A3D9V418_THECX|nr:monosaccharide ABC transporter substrate-binding protein (CUT2 family) [Thermasporomyces composti]
MTPAGREEQLHPLRRAFLAFLSVGLVVASAAGCGAEDTGSGGDGYRISLIVGLKGDDFYGSLACGARQAAKKLGVELDVQGPNKWDAAEQIPILNSVIAARPDAILIAPVDDTALQAPLEQAAAHGITVVLVDTTVKNPSFAVSQVTSDDELAGEKAAEEVIRLTGGTGAVVTINTQPGVSTVAARVRGFEKRLAQEPGIEYVGERFAGDDAAKASSVVTSTLAAHPNLAAVFATNTLTGQGAATGIRNAHKSGEIKLIGFDANPSGVQALRDGSAQGQVVLKPLDIGAEGVEQAVNALSGKPVTKLIRTGSFVATKDNLDDPETQKYLYRESCTGA